MEPSIFNIRVPLESSSDVFLMNTLTDAQLVVSSQVAALIVFPLGEEFGWRGRVDGPVDVPEVPAEQLVEGCVVTGRVIVPVPPVPVGSFRDEEFLVRRVVLRGREPRRGGVEGPSGIAELAPGTAVVVVAYPDVEVAIDPRAREDRGQRTS